MKLDDICLKDVAHALSHKARFTGHTKKFYCVADHSVRVSLYLKSVGASIMEQFIGLHHDDSDAYLPDVPTPLKVLPEFSWFREIEKTIEKLCYEKFGCVINDYAPIKTADRILLVTEKRDLMPVYKGAIAQDNPIDKAIPAPYTIRPLTSRQAKKAFLLRHKELTSELTLGI